MAQEVIFLPGGVMPADLAYGPLLEALGDDVKAIAKDLEVYAGPKPPPGYTLDDEIAGVLRTAGNAGFDRFHLVGYSGGGASSVAFAAKHPERLLSLALLEPAWLGNDGLSPEEQAVWQEFDRIATLPSKEMMAAFVAIQLARASRRRHRRPAHRHRGWRPDPPGCGPSWRRSARRRSTSPACALSSSPSTSRWVAGATRITTA
jgi:pimeloyl-ACP methyl ester carboxylesterase